MVDHRELSPGKVQRKENNFRLYFKDMATIVKEKEPQTVGDIMCGTFERNCKRDSDKGTRGVTLKNQPYPLHMKFENTKVRTPRLKNQTMDILKERRNLATFLKIQQMQGRVRKEMGTATDN